MQKHAKSSMTSFDFSVLAVNEQARARGFLSKIPAPARCKYHNPHRHPNPLPTRQSKIDVRTAKRFAAKSEAFRRRQRVGVPVLVEVNARLWFSTCYVRAFPQTCGKAIQSLSKLRFSFTACLKNSA
jgi:hypothetical protein